MKSPLDRLKDSLSESNELKAFAILEEHQNNATEANAAFLLAEMINAKHRAKVQLIRTERAIDRLKGLLED